MENEDELAVSLDLHQLVGLKKGERRAFLESMLQACASNATPAFIDKCLERISKLDARVSDAISAAGPTTTFGEGSPPLHHTGVALWRREFYEKLRREFHGTPPFTTVE